MATSGSLVVCYSRGGTTVRVARYIADALRADFDLIEEPGSRGGFGGYARSALEALARGLPTIRTQKNPRDYALVVLGTPVWTGTMASPVRAYLAAHARHLQNPAFFAVMAGRGGDATVREMKFACSAPDAASCVFTQSDVEQGRFRQPCADFIRALHSKPEPTVLAGMPPAA